MAKAVPEPGQQVKQTTYTEVLPASAKTADVEKLGFWEYLLSLTPNDYAEHICYVYRWLQNSNDYSAVGKLSLPFDEFTLKDNFGGGTFRLYLKRKGQLYKRIDRVVIEGNPKNPDDAPAPASNFGSASHNGDPLGLIARILENQNQLFERLLTQKNSSPSVDEAYRGALQLQADALRTGVSTVRDLNPGPSAAVNPMDEITKTFMMAAIQKMLNPADPIESFAKMASALKTVMPEQAGSTSWGVEAIRAIGQALPSIAQAYTASQLPPRAAAPSNGRTIDVQPQPLRANSDDTRNNVTPMPGPANPALPANGNATNAAPAAPAPQGGDVQPPNVEWVEDNVVKIINDLELSPDDAAFEAAAWLQRSAPGMLPQLASEATLRWLFSNRTILRTVPDNARREEFIQAFLRVLNRTPAPAAAPEPADTLLLKPDPPPAS